MLNRPPKVCHRCHPNGGGNAAPQSAYFRVFAAILGIYSLTALLSGCADKPLHGRQITAAVPLRHTQHFEAELLSFIRGRCVVRTKMPNQRLPGTWIDERNSALRAALYEAKQCCDNPRLQSVEDWMVGFTAYEATFICQSPET
ncbi:MAG: hypothetical protein ACU84Q_12145 [Gammaproteobacteria bacterium]